MAISEPPNLLEEVLTTRSDLKDMIFEYDIPEEVVRFKSNPEKGVLLGISAINNSIPKPIMRPYFEELNTIITNIKGLTRPPLNKVFRAQLKIEAPLGLSPDGDNIGGKFNPTKKFLRINNPVTIYNFNRSTESIYASIIHELAHAVHWKIDNHDYRESSIKLIESWARGVERELTEMIYSSYKPYYVDNYTGVVEDMIDTDKNIPTAINESVSGYTISQIEKTLKGVRTWNAWRDKIKSKYNNPTEQYLDALFSNW